MSEKDNLPKADGIKKDTSKEDSNENFKVIEKHKPEINEVSQAFELVEISETVDTAATIDDKETKKDNKATNSPIDEIDNVSPLPTQDTDSSENANKSSDNYKDMSMKDLVIEFKSLVDNHKIQSIRNHVDVLRKTFNTQYNELIEKKKEAFLEDGGNPIDFEFNFQVKTDFNTINKIYRSKQKEYYKKLESSLQFNHSKRLEIIEEIKGLINVEENINTTYKHFKELQESWKNAGPIPRDKYNNVWNNYHHHVEIFYDFLHLNRDLRDLDFKHNLEQKLKIIERAEELAQDDNSNRAFRELQALHKIWKEELGPVERERREEIWQRFSSATKLIHEKRQLYFKEIDKAYEINLEVKHNIISKINKITADESNNHSAWQKKIKTVEELRTLFFNAGKVPIKVNEDTWTNFKKSVRAFNRKKNSYYKGLKKDQYQNLQKKLELIKIAESNKDSSDFTVTTPLMKKIQHDWKKIGHVPRRESDKIWKQFKTACNAYFDKLHESKNTANKEELEAYEKKITLLENIKNIKFTEDKTSNLNIIKQQTEFWKSIGNVPYHKRSINKKFNTVIDELYKNLNIGKNETELLKYKNKLESISNDKKSLDNEHNFVRKKIDELKAEINQLENNLQFFSNVGDDNPLVRDVHNNIIKRKDDLSLWDNKLKNIKQYY